MKTKTRKRPVAASSISLKGMVKKEDVMSMSIEQRALQRGIHYGHRHQGQGTGEEWKVYEEGYIQGAKEQRVADIARALGWLSERFYQFDALEEVNLRQDFVDMLYDIHRN